MEFATQDIISELTEKRNMSITDAMSVFYASEFAGKLFDESTGLYIEGSKYLYELLDAEIENGKFVQQEI